MGFRANWVAVRSTSMDDLASECGLTRTGEFASCPDWGVSAASFPVGWLVLVFNDEDEDEFVSRLSTLSASSETLAVSVNETVMHSSIAGWQAGRQAWSVTHDSERDRHDLRVSGEPPEPFAAIRDRLLQEQADHDATHRNPTVDYVFDIPPELGEALVGFRLDAASEDEPAWERWETPKPPAPWWRRWLGGDTT